MNFALEFKNTEILLCMDLKPVPLLWTKITCMFTVHGDKRKMIYLPLCLCSVRIIIDGCTCALCSVVIDGCTLCSVRVMIDSDSTCAVCAGHERCCLYLYSVPAMIDGRKCALCSVWIKIGDCTRAVYGP